MANASGKSTANQQKIEKKDLPLRAKHSDRRGTDSTDNFNDEDQARAKGQRTTHSMPGGKGKQSDAAGSAPMKDNTRPGGNRPKGREKHGSMGDVDHN